MQNPAIALAREHIKAGLWSQATEALAAVAHIAGPEVSGHCGLAAFYSGRFQDATSLFSAHPSFASFRAAAAAEKFFPKVCDMKTELNRAQGTENPWLAGTGDSPDSDFVSAFRRFSVTKAEADLNLLPYPGTSVREMAALAQAHLIFAYRKNEHVGRALTVAEDLSKFNAEGRVLSPWFVAHALLLHGKMAARQGNALIAEALCDAAKEKAEEAFSLQGNTGRNEVLLWRCLKQKADLLVKWDKREAQGVQILESIAGKFNLTEIADASEVFVPPPSLHDLDQVLRSISCLLFRFFLFEFFVSLLVHK